MLKLFGRVLLLSLLAAFVAVLVWAGSLTPSYQKCKAEYAQSEARTTRKIHRRHAMSGSSVPYRSFCAARETFSTQTARCSQPLPQSQ
jgi:hypothetical protein